MSLTDDWKAGKLPNGNYFCKTALDAIDVFKCVDNVFFTFADENQIFYISEILADCDYNHFVELTKKVKALEKEVAKGDRIIGALLNEGNAAINKNKQLRELLKECNNELKLLRMLSLPMASGQALNECDDLLARINAAIGESEE